MKKLLAVLLMLALLVPLTPASAESSGPITPGGTFPDFTVETTGGTFTLSEALREKDAVLLIFWATWCGPCVHEFPFIQQVYEAHGDRLAVVALSVEPTDTMEVIAGFAEEHGLTFPMGRDEPSLFYRTGEAGIPTPVVIDRFGTVCYLQAGAMPDADHAARLVEPFLGDGYTESLVLDGIPGPRPDVAAADDAALSAALNAEGGSLAFTGDPAGYEWPFLPQTVDGREAAASTNGAAGSTAAAAYTSLTAAEGDVLAFDLTVDSAPGAYLTVTDNGVTAKSFTGSREWTSWALPLEPGEHEIALRFTVGDVPERDPGAAPAQGAFANVRLLSGEAARSALDALPVYPVAETASVEPLCGPVRPVMLMYDGMELLAEGFGTTGWLFEGDRIRVRVTADASVDPDAAVVADTAAGEARVLSTLLNAGGDAYEFETAAADGMTGVVLYGAGYPDDVLADTYFWPDEEEAAAFAGDLAAGYGIEIETVFGEPAGAEEAPGGEADYTITVVDRDGAPVAGAVVNICTDTTCMPMETGEDGVIAFRGEKLSYHLQVLRLPDGCRLDDGAEEFWTGSETAVTIEVVREG